MYRQPWLYEYILLSKKHFSIKTLFIWVLTSGAVWGLYSCLYLLAEVDSLKRHQQKSFSENTQKLNQLVQQAEIILSLDCRDQKNDEGIFDSFQRDFENAFRKTPFLNWSLTLISREKPGMKLTKYGWTKSDAGEADKTNKILDEAQNIQLNPLGNLVMLPAQIRPGHKSFLMLRLSSRSIAKYLEADDLLLVPKEASVPLKKGKHVCIIPIGEAIQAVYFVPDILLTDRALVFLSTNGFWLMIVILLSTMGGAILHLSILIRIYKGFEKTINDQQESISAITADFSSANQARTSLRTELTAIKIQLKAEGVLFSAIKDVSKQLPIQNQLIQLLKRGLRLHSRPLNDNRIAGNETSIQDMASFSVSLEKIDSLCIIDELLACFEVLRQQKNLQVEVPPSDSGPIYAKAIDLKAILYNIFKRVFARSKKNGLVHISLLDDPDKLTIRIVDNGYMMDNNHESVFVGNSSLLMLMTSWDELIELAQMEGIRISAAAISAEEWETTISCPKTPVVIESSSNVVQFVPRV